MSRTRTVFRTATFAWESPGYALIYRCGIPRCLCEPGLHAVALALSTRFDTDATTLTGTLRDFQVPKTDNCASESYRIHHPAHASFSCCQTHAPLVRASYAAVPIESFATRSCTLTATTHLRCRPDAGRAETRGRRGVQRNVPTPLCGVCIRVDTRVDVGSAGSVDWWPLPRKCRRHCQGASGARRG